MTQICGWGKIRRKLCATMDNTHSMRASPAMPHQRGTFQSGAERSVVLLCPITRPTRTRAPFWPASRSRPQSFWWVCGTTAHSAYPPLFHRLGHRLHAIPDGRHDHHPFPYSIITATIRWPACSTAIQAIALAVATPLLGKLTDKFGQEAGLDSDDYRLDCGRHRAGDGDYQPRAGMGAVLSDAVPGRHSAVGRDEPRALDQDS